MGRMSDLDILARRVLDGETIDDVAEDTVYPKDEIEWAIHQMR